MKGRGKGGSKNHQRGKGKEKCGKSRSKGKDKTLAKAQAKAGKGDQGKSRSNATVPFLASAGDADEELHQWPATPVWLTDVLATSPGSAVDEDLWQHPSLRPDLAAIKYSTEHEALRTVTVIEQKKSMPNMFHEGRVARILVKALPSLLVESILEEMHDQVFELSTAERSAFRGGGKRPTVPLPVFRHVCDLYLLRGVAMPCLRELCVFDSRAWRLKWADLSKATGSWVSAAFNVMTGSGLWHIAVTKKLQIISAWPISGVNLSHEFLCPQTTERPAPKCMKCYGCTGICIRVREPERSVLASVFSHDLQCLPPGANSRVQADRLPCSCGRLHSGGVNAFKCICEPCGGRLRQWATAVKAFWDAHQAGEDTHQVKLELKHLSTNIACAGCAQDRRHVAVALQNDSNEELAISLRPWLDDETHEVSVSQIRFSQPAINSTFTGDHAGQDLESLVRQLRLGRVTTQQFAKPISVVRYHGNLWALDHRRLWCFWHFQLLETSEDVKAFVTVRALRHDNPKDASSIFGHNVIQEFNRKYETSTGGRTMRIKNTVVPGSGTGGMARSTMTSIVHGDLKNMRMHEPRQKRAAFELGGECFGDARDVKEWLQLTRGDNGHGAPVPASVFQVLVELFKYHPKKQDVVSKVKMISVATSEVWGSPTFWLWDDVGHGTDIDSTVALNALEYWLEYSPQQHPERITQLGDETHVGHIRQSGERFSFIHLSADVTLGNYTISAEDPLFCLRHDLPTQAVVGSRVEFQLFRWKDRDLLPERQQKNAGKLGALNVRLA